MDILMNTCSDDSLYIFTDASTCGKHACAGAVAILNRKILKETNRVLTYATSNKGEIEAIKDGVYLAILLTRIYPNIKNIYLLSDSELSVLGIRDRILNWYICCGNYISDQQVADFKLTTKSGSLLSNQDSYVEVLYTLLKYNLNIKFYHQKGHVDYSNHKDFRYAKELFKKNNNINVPITDEFIQFISMGNAYVDNNSRTELYKQLKQLNYCIDNPVRFIIQDIDIFKEDIDKYKQMYGGQYNGRNERDNKEGYRKLKRLSQR